MRSALLLLGLLSPIALAHADPKSAPATPTLQSVVVSGEMPGPGLWKVSQGDHVLWVLGTITPVPKRMIWRSSEVERVIAQAQEILPSSAISVQVKIGFFRGLLLLPKLFGVRNNPEKATLAEQLPEALYARWQVLKAKYLPYSRKVERWRPIFAADRLYSRAIARTGLEEDSPVAPVVGKLVKRYKVPTGKRSTSITLDDPKKVKAMIEEFSSVRLNDIGCFELMLDHLESDLQTMTQRANAWAVGDIERLRELPFVDPGPECIRAVLDVDVLQRYGLDRLPERNKQAWVEMAGKALTDNRVSFATLPMRQILAEDGYLAALRDRGYMVEAPE